ncbi:sulfotransferase [Acrocarpospora pleiomorpha]|uniref:Sulfotransferase n=1 Tax=Acrocarpospora pleiomorpha TaxID=90975 RepID=A0A5M3XCQ1_9ACTN|nr:sulfotransferase domain-containing protein [Acrocarpospora pleiomorpha]GES17291.1 sulfotransferase [Acrocarpospora pleiomorpha]
MHDPDPTFMHDNYDDIRDFPLADGDVVISGFPKSGTNWMQVMLSGLWDGWGTLSGGSRQVPNLSGKDRPGYRGYLACVASPSPRLIKTHLPVELMPRSWPEAGKVVHITRNPKDVCVSYFYEVKGLRTHAAGSRYETGDDFSIHDFAEQFARGEVPYGPYTDNVIGWRQTEHPSLLKITYEQARADVRATLAQVIEFVGRPVSRERLEEVIAKTEFNAMRDNDLRFEINHADLREGREDATPFMRKGIVGDWKRELSTYDSELIDDTVVARLESAGVHLTYAPGRT